MDRLKKLRSNKMDKAPKYSCGNCNCKRYSSCNCMKSNGDNRKTRNASKRASQEAKAQQ